MGLPEIIINFQTLATTAILRSAKGVVALAVKDSTDVSFDTKIYKDITEVDPLDWKAANLDYIEKTFLGSPSKVIVERVANDAENFNAALTRLQTKKWNYLAIPGAAAGDVSTVVTWLKARRDTDKKTFKLVIPASAPDHEGIIDFQTDDIEVGVTTYTNYEYCARIAGILAGLPFSRSSTYYALSEVESITESADPDGDIDDGKLILINDGANIKIARGVNSLTTTSTEKGAIFKKIKIIDGVDLVRDDIRDTFDTEYVGKVINNYDNKMLFLAAINAYFKIIAKEDILDVNYENIAEIDIESQRTYLESIGVDLSVLEEQQIKEYNTGSKVFAKANVRFVDAIEDLYFEIYM